MSRVAIALIDLVLVLVAVSALVLFTVIPIAFVAMELVGIWFVFMRFQWLGGGALYLAGVLGIRWYIAVSLMMKEWVEQRVKRQ